MGIATVTGNTILHPRFQAILQHRKHSPSDAACRLSFGDAWCRRTATQRRLPPSDIHIAREKKKVLTHQWQLHPFHLLFFQVLEVAVVAASAWNRCLHSQHRNHPHLHLARQETRPSVKQIIKQNQAPFPFILSQTWWHRHHAHLVTRWKPLPASCRNSFARCKFKK